MGQAATLGARGLVRIHGPSCTDDASGRGRYAPVEPAELDLRAGLGAFERLGDHRERIRGGERRQDVAPLPAREAHADPAASSRTGSPSASRIEVTRW